jgi:hypothetical protein
MGISETKDMKRYIPVMLFCLVLIVGIRLAPAIGPAWDEPDNINAGGVYIRFIQSGFDRKILESADHSGSYFSQKIYTQDPTIARYPPVPLYVGGVIALVREKLMGSLTADDIIVAFHFATVLFFALLVSTVYRFGRLLGLGGWLSVFAALTTFLFPTLFGHGLSNIKDTAQVSLFTLSLYYLVRGNRGNKGNWGDMGKGAVIWGLALATKFNAIYVPIIWCLWVATAEVGMRCSAHRQVTLLSSYGVHTLRDDARKRTPPRVGLVMMSLSWVIIIGLVTAIVVWPYLWSDPIGNAWKVISYFTTVGQGYKIFWDGIRYLVGVGKPLWWYPWAVLFFATPIMVLLLVFIGGIQVIGGVRKNTRKTILLIWMIVPLARAVLPNAAFYDGIRHFMEILPAVLLLAGVGLEQLGKLGRVGKVSIVVVGGGVLMQMLVINSTYFPYSTGYYNMFARDANVRYDRDIEALSIKEGVEYLHKRYGPVHLWAPVGGFLSWYYLTEGDAYVYEPGMADSIVLINKSSHAIQKVFDLAVQDNFRVDHVITRGDAVFGWVYRRK